MLITSLPPYARPVREPLPQPDGIGIAVVTGQAISEELRRAALFAAAELMVAGLSVVTVEEATAGYDGYLLAGAAGPAVDNAPVVVLDDRGHPGSRLTVSASPQDVGQLAARHLREFGRRSLIVVTDDDADDQQQRLAAGFGSGHPDTARLTSSEFTAADGAGGVFATSGAAVIAVLATLARRRLQVPNAVAVVGFGVHAVQAGHLPVPLTTVGMPSRRMGSAAARMLLAALEGRSLRTTARTIGPELTVRRSAPHATRASVARHRQSLVPTS